MPRDWEAQFRQWASPPGKTEEQRCDNAVKAIKNALEASKELKFRNIQVFAQGSYRNNTNVRKDSDVDIGVLCTDTYFYDLPSESATAAQFGIIPATYSYADFKNDVGAALAAYFGKDSITRGNKAFDIHETTYHVEADVAPFFVHRRYHQAGTWLTGVELRSDKGDRVINWPEHHYENGIQKNKDTGTRYKSIVRVLKALSAEMVEAKIPQGNIPGFLIECLLWNTPNSCLDKDAPYAANVREAIIYLYSATKDEAPCKEWGEVSELKYLFRLSQKWTRQQANDFLLAAWNYVGFNS